MFLLDCFYFFAKLWKYSVHRRFLLNENNFPFNLWKGNLHKNMFLQRTMLLNLANVLSHKNFINQNKNDRNQIDNTTKANILFHMIVKNFIQAPDKTSCFIFDKNAWYWKSVFSSGNLIQRHEVGWVVWIAYVIDALIIS